MGLRKKVVRCLQRFRYISTGKYQVSIEGTCDLFYKLHIRDGEPDEVELCPYFDDFDR